MLNSDSVCALVLAAGKGVRMESAQPKVLHTLAERPILSHVIDNVRSAGIRDVYVVVGYKSDDVVEQTGDISIKWVTQEKQLGTGHAVRCAGSLLKNYPGNIVVMNGDCPFISPDTIKGIAARHSETNASATILTCRVENPAGYGRIIRNGYPDERLTRIVEDKDATEDERKINEVNVGLYCFRARDIFSILDELHNDNVKQEYYLTEVVQLINDRGMKTAAYESTDSREVFNVNTLEELHEAETILKEKGE